MERDPWFSEKNCKGPFPTWDFDSSKGNASPLGCKPDGGGCHRAQGKVGGMALHRACCNRDMGGTLFVVVVVALFQETREEKSGQKAEERVRRGAPLRGATKGKKKTAAKKKTRPFLVFTKKKIQPSAPPSPLDPPTPTRSRPRATPLSTLPRSKGGKRASSFCSKTEQSRSLRTTRGTGPGTGPATWATTPSRTFC